MHQRLNARYVNTHFLHRPHISHRGYQKIAIIFVRNESPIKQMINIGRQHQPVLYFKSLRRVIALTPWLAMTGYKKFRPIHASNGNGFQLQAHLPETVPALFVLVRMPFFLYPRTSVPQQSDARDSPPWPSTLQRQHLNIVTVRSGRHAPHDFTFWRPD